MKPMMMSHLIEFAKSGGIDGDLVLYSYWEQADSPAAAALLQALAVTGPVIHGGRLYRAGDGETYRTGIDVIDGVRPADAVPVPSEILMRAAALL